MLIQSLILGIGATFIMDLYAYLQNRVLYIKPLNYALIGRWFLSFKDRKFIHQNIMQSPERKFESSVGWFIHYLIGIFWAFCYLQLQTIFSFNYSLISTLLFAICTTLLPLVIMQPALGFGFFASKTPIPLKSIRNSLIAHLIFGIGLYFTSQLIHLYQS